MAQKLRIINIIAIGGILFSFFSCNKTDHFVRTEGMIWNTLYHITYKGPESFKDSILPVLDEIGHSLSVFEKNSLTDQLNHSSMIEADRHLITVYDKAKEINRISEGKFDPTLSPLINAWGFGLNHKASSDTLRIDSLLQLVGIEKTSRNGSVISKENPEIQFNFSAIAKGYGCDAVGEMFRRNGINDFMIEIGGEITLSGISPSGGDWKIAIDSPIDNIAPGEECVTVISLTDAGIATSGNYRNFRIEGGKKVAHTISAATGRPFIGEVLSATIVSPTCMEADAIATTCMASSLSEAAGLLEATGSQGLIITDDTVWMSPGFKKYIIDEVSGHQRKDRN